MVVEGVRAALPAAIPGARAELVDTIVSHEGDVRPGVEIRVRWTDPSGALRREGGRLIDAVAESINTPGEVEPTVAEILRRVSLG